MEAIGYAGAILLAICALPQMIMSILDGHSRGLSHMFLMSWYIGEIFMLAFTLSITGPTGPLFYNYAINTLMLTVIVKYKYLPRSSVG